LYVQQDCIASDAHGNFLWYLAWHSRTRMCLVGEPFWTWVLDTVGLRGVVADSGLVMLACNLALCMLLTNNAALRILLVCYAKRYARSGGDSSAVQEQLQV